MGAIAVFDAVNGVEPQSETVWRQANKYKVPRICFINKMDRVGADFYYSVETIKTKLGATPVPVQLPIGAEDKFQGIIDLVEEKAIYWVDDVGDKMEIRDIPDSLKDDAKTWRDRLIEKACEANDQLMDKYLGGEEISKDEMRKGLRLGCLSMQLVPVFCGSAFKNKGCASHCSMVLVAYLPSPLDRPPVERSKIRARA